MIADALPSILLPSKDYGNVRVATIPVVGGRWQSLDSLRGTPWGNLIPVVNGSVMADARHGRMKPLMSVIGRPPLASLRIIPDPHRICDQRLSCGSFNADECHPNQKLPDCYDPPELVGGVQKNDARLLALSWRDGIYVVVVDGPEFSF